VPPPSPLAQAIHGALTAPSVQGISANIQFTNHLIGSAELQGSDPLLSGATGRVWLSNDHQLRLELQGSNGDANVVVSNGSWWAYIPSTNTVYEGSLPARSGARDHARKAHAAPSVAEIQSDINRVAQHLGLSGAVPSDVAGRPAYTVTLTPKPATGLLSSVQLAWDAFKGVPLRFAVYAQGDPSPVLELKATGITYGAVPSGIFSISPPRRREGRQGRDADGDRRQIAREARAAPWARRPRRGHRHASGPDPSELPAFRARDARRDAAKQCAAARIRPQARRARHPTARGSAGSRLSSSLRPPPARSSST